MRLRCHALGLFAVLPAVFVSGFMSIRAVEADSVSPTPSALSTDSTGWQNVMPPASLKGWFRVPIPMTVKLGRAQWHVEDGNLICDGNGGHDMLLLDRKFRNCIFHVEFCFTKIEGMKGYNSGVFIRTSRDGAVWNQAQVGSRNGGYWFGVTSPVPGTKKYNVPSNPCRVTEAGEWNIFELTAQGRTLSLWVNGFETATFPDCGLDEGYLGLEGEGHLITFRNLKIKVLP